MRANLAQLAAARIHVYFMSTNVGRSTFPRMIQRIVIALAVLAVPAAASTTCPDPVKAAVEKVFPKSKLLACKAEKEHGRDQFEAKITKADGGQAELDVTPDGKVLQIEEAIAVDQVPAVVRDAFAKRYKGAKIERAERQQPTGGKTSYELAFATDKGRKEATFSEDGTFVEEE
jgi:hypothetical protein